MRLRYQENEFLNLSFLNKFAIFLYIITKVDNKLSSAKLLQRV